MTIAYPNWIISVQGAAFTGRVALNKFPTAVGYARCKVLVSLHGKEAPQPSRNHWQGSEFILARNRFPWSGSPLPPWPAALFLWTLRDSKPNSCFMISHNQDTARLPSWGHKFQKDDDVLYQGRSTALKVHCQDLSQWFLPFPFILPCIYLAINLTQLLPESRLSGAPEIVRSHQ